MSLTTLFLSSIENYAIIKKLSIFNYLNKYRNVSINRTIGFSCDITYMWYITVDLMFIGF